MLVIRKVSTGAVYPAENLRWTEAYQSGNYTIHSVAAALTGASVPTEVTTSATLNDIELGQIGKSGRFVAITEQYLNP